MDVILLFLPALVYVFLARPSLRTFGLIAGGFAPFLIWEIFSFIYYGFFLPNTYYAKLNTGIPLVVLMRQGLVYFSDSLSTDPITLAVIALASLFAIMRQGRRERAVALGVMLYLLYILYFGGDFMSGRFFSAPYLASAFLLVRHLNGLRNRYAWLAASLLLALGLSASRPTFILPGRQDAEKAAADFETYGVADIKARAFQTSSLLVWRPGVQIFPNEKVTRRGMRYRDEQRKVAVDGTVGLVGFFGGPQLHLIDGYALADPLLARLPVMKSAKWLPAHFPREIPAGYLETIASGENRIQNPDLALYYDKLRLIISGDLWTQERWEAIWKMNTGQYDYLLQNYLASSNN
jgi:arabinofuranosyltransferase